jgi:hypothetical protein
MEIKQLNTFILESTGKTIKFQTTANLEEINQIIEHNHISDTRLGGPYHGLEKWLRKEGFICRQIQG